jgi:hypothetical protein
MAEPAIPSIQLNAGTYREALWEVLCANVGRAVLVADLPARVGRGDDPLYASKRLNLKLARAGGDLEIRRIQIGDYEAFGLFDKTAPSAITVPVLSARHGAAYDPKTKRSL